MVVLLAVVYCATSLTAVLGNSTVIFIVLTSRRMQVLTLHTYDDVPLFDLVVSVRHELLHCELGPGGRDHRPAGDSVPIPGRLPADLDLARFSLFLLSIFPGKGYFIMDFFT